MLPSNTPPRPKDIEAIPEQVHPAKRTVVANYLAAASLIVAALTLAVILKWSFASTNILEVHNSPFPARVVPDPTGQTGGIVFLKADYCKNSDIVGEIRMSYVSKSREVFLPLAKEQMQKGCESKEVPVIIPLNLVKDEYKIRFRATYDINPLKRDVTTYFESQPVVVGTNTSE